LFIRQTMSDAKKTKEQLVKELEELRRKIAKLEGSESKSKQISEPFFLTEKSTSETILSAIGDGISIQAPNFRILYQNQIHKDLVGDHVGELCYKAYAKRDDICEDCPLVISFKDGKIHRAERSVVTDNGTLYLAVTASPLKNAEGKIAAGIEVVRNITKRKEAEETLELERRQLLSIFDSINEVIYVSDPETYEVLYANKAVTAKFGNAVGQKCHRVFQDMDSPCTFCTNKYIFGKNEGQPYIWEFQNRSNQHWYRCIDKAIRWPDGRMVRYEMAIDITERKKTEEMLLMNLAAMEASLDGIAVLNQNGEYLYLNDAHAKVYGYSSPKELIGKTWKVIYSEEEIKRIEKEFLPALTEKGRWSGEATGKKKDGSTYPQEISLSIIEGKGTVCIVRDITERKKAEENLKLFLRAIEEGMDGIQIVDLNGIIIYSNKAIEEMYGFSADELWGKHVNEMNADKEFAGKVIIPSIKETGHWNGEIRVVRTNGREFPVWLSASMVKDNKGEPIAMVGIIRDITERKKAEEALKESEEKYRLLIENIQDGVFIIQDAKIKFSNEAFAGMIGYTAEELSGIDIKKLIAPEDLEMVMERYKQRLDGKDIPKEYEFRMLHKDGVTRVFVNMLVGLIDYQGKAASMGTVKDMTERKKMEAEIQKAQKLESLGILAGGIAHDFNNILTAITGNISLAKMYAKPGLEVYDILTEVEKASLRAKNLTTQLLTFSKGGIPVKKLTSITKLIKDSASFALSGSNVKCEISIQDNLWPAEIDEGQVSQVIHHLIINAQQAMPQGGIIRLNAENIVLDKGHPLPLNVGKYIKISLYDEGIGIPQEYLLKIFDPYFTTKQEGSGLGLATAYSIIKKHDGYITVESKLGAGTTFSVYLPASETEIPISKDTVTLTPAGKGKGKILVMDDDEIVRIVVGRMLSQCGYEAEFAEHGEGAIELYKKAKESGAPFDAVIIDLVIPAGMGGKDAMQKLLELDPDIRAIVSSGYSDDTVMSDYRKYGFKGSLAKPYEITDLRQMLHNVITGTAL